MYTIITFLPDNLVTALAPHRQQYDPLVDIIPPHISALGPFHLPSDSLPLLYDHLEEVGETHASIKVSLAGWDVYDQADYQIWLPIIAGRRELMALHNDLLAGPFRNLANHPQPYCPHITLGRFSKRSKLEKAKKSLKGFEPHFVFRINHLVLMYRYKPTQPWQKQKNISLEATILSPPRRKKSARTKYSAASHK